HVVLGLLFLKYISDAFERRYADLEADRGTGANPEDPDEYRATSVYWVPKEVRWSVIHAAARQPTIGQLIDDAMVALERDNSALKETLPKDYARATVDKSRLGKLVDLVSDIGLGERRRSLELHARARLRILPLGIR
ncbi:MAG: type I restriction-modification system subunit M N-terminal domain-containing protein, partial [Gemmatimonadaceae bacterium]|nr:type I restriction-modification system subunit M N-terminal domain-containing protein [Gemmatimonadaceae bacterium]